MDTTGGGGIDICSTSVVYMDFSIPHREYAGRFFENKHDWC
jgi:hypothetical protein